MMICLKVMITIDYSALEILIATIREIEWLIQLQSLTINDFLDFETAGPDSIPPNVRKRILDVSCSDMKGLSFHL